MKNGSIQCPAVTRWRSVRTIVLEAVLVVVVGMALAFAANQISPRGLALTRNYFPNGTNNAVRMAVSPTRWGGATGTNDATFSLTELLAAQMKQKGLQLINGQRAVQLFHDSRLKQDGIVFIDARDAEEYRAGHIPSAYEFDPYHPEKYFPVVLPVCQAAKQIVVYCNGGDCDDSETAALLLRDVGIPNQKLFVYGGGITEWTNNRLPVVTGTLNNSHPRNPRQ